MLVGWLVAVLTVGSFIGAFVLLYLLLAVLIWFFGRSPVVQSKEGAPRHVVVTGGSSGIGLEAARLYLQRGLKVTIIARNPGRLDAACLELAPPSSAQLQAISCDLSASEPDVFKAIDQAVSAFGPVDILINCAGISIAGEFSALAPAAFRSMLEVNVLGSVYPTRAVVPSMKARGRGHIVFVSSQVAQAAIHGYTAYAASKWALRGLAEALQMELKPYNVHVSLSYPPDTRTPGYAEEMLAKPLITKLLSETGTVLEATQVAADIVHATLSCNVYTISSGMDGALLKQLHAGMTPVNNAWEVTTQVFLASFSRFIAVFYLFYWQHIVSTTVRGASKGSKGSKVADDSSSRSSTAM